MRICYSSDFHGRQTLYDQLQALLRAEQPELVILGGDMFPDGEGPDPAGAQVAFVHRELLPRVAAWSQDVPGLATACLMGNHDWLSTERALRAAPDSGLTVLDLRQPWVHNGVGFVGCPYSPPTPHWVKDYERLDAEGDEMPDFGIDSWATQTGGPCEVDAGEHFHSKPPLAAELAAAAIPADPWVLVAHAPPYDCKLDRLPNIDYPVGSTAVRRFIASERPLCALHGHVHEAPVVSGSYFDEVAGVLCINPGQSHERLQAVLFDTERPRETLRHTVFR